MLAALVALAAAAPAPAAGTTLLRLDGVGPLRLGMTFTGGRLRDLSFRRGVRTAAGVVVGSTTVRQMVAAYRRPGYRASARFDDVFSATFVTVLRRGRQVMDGAAGGRIVTSLGIPAVPVCE